MRCQIATESELSRSVVQFSIPIAIEVNVRDFAQLSHDGGGASRRRRGVRLATLNLDHLVKIAARSGLCRRLCAPGSDRRRRQPGRRAVAAGGTAGRAPARGRSDRAACAGLAAETTSPWPSWAARAHARQRGRGAAHEVPGLRIVMREAPPMGFDPEGRGRAHIRQARRRLGGAVPWRSARPSRNGLPRAGTQLRRAPGLPPSARGSISSPAGNGARPHGCALAMEWLWRALHDLPPAGPRYARCFAILPRPDVRSALRLRRHGR